MTSVHHTTGSAQQIVATVVHVYQYQIPHIMFEGCHLIYSGIPGMGQKNYRQNRGHRPHYPYTQVGRQLFLAHLINHSTALASNCGYRRTRRNALDYSYPEFLSLRVVRQPNTTRLDTLAYQRTKPYNSETGTPNNGTRYKVCTKPRTGSDSMLPSLYTYLELSKRYTVHILV